MEVKQEGLSKKTYKTLCECVGNGGFLGEALKASYEWEPVFEHTYFGPKANEQLSEIMGNYGEGCCNF